MVTLSERDPKTVSEPLPKRHANRSRTRSRTVSENGVRTISQRYSNRFRNGRNGTRTVSGTAGTVLEPFPDDFRTVSDRFPNFSEWDGMGWDGTSRSPGSLASSTTPTRSSRTWVCLAVLRCWWPRSSCSPRFAPCSPSTSTAGKKMNSLTRCDHRIEDRTCAAGIAVV